MTLFKTTIVAILLLMAVESANAVLIFTDRIAWNGAAGTFATETFDNTIINADSIVLDNGIVSTAIPSSMVNSLNNVGVNTAGAYTGRVGLVDHPQLIRWDLPSGINAWFADFGFLNFNGLVVRGNWDGTGNVTLNIAATIGSGGGFGIIGNAAFTSFEWRTGDQSEFFTVDNFSSASASVTVPEPGTLALFGLGLFGMVARRKKKV